MLAMLSDQPAHLVRLDILVHLATADLVFQDLAVTADLVFQDLAARQEHQVSPVFLGTAVFQVFQDTADPEFQDTADLAFQVFQVSPDTLENLVRLALQVSLDTLENLVCLAPQVSPDTAAFPAFPDSKEQALILLVPYQHNTIYQQLAINQTMRTLLILTATYIFGTAQLGLTLDKL